MSDHDTPSRHVLPMPDRPRAGATTYDAKDPDTKYPPIRELRPATRPIMGPVGDVVQRSIDEAQPGDHRLSAGEAIPVAMARQ